MLYVPSECQFHLDWTLQFYGKPINGTAAFVAEFDAKLTIVWWQDETTDQTIWRVDAADTGYGLIDAESDPEMWALVERAVKRDRPAIGERVEEYVAEALS